MLSDTEIERIEREQRQLIRARRESPFFLEPEPKLEAERERDREQQSASGALAAELRLQQCCKRPA